MLDGTSSDSEQRPREEHRPGVGSNPATDPTVAEREVEDAFLRVVDEGRRRMSRRWTSLLATGAVGGIDVGSGVLGLLLVEAATGSKLLGGVAFSIGFIALTLARSELFTENFLIPVSTVIARQARTRMLLRLWAGTLITNLLAGWLFTWLIMRGFPSLSRTAVQAGYHYVQLGTGLRAFCLAVLGGAVITLMTWMQHTTPGPVAGVGAAMLAGFLLAGGSLDHAIVSSLLMFAALHTGHAPFGYGQWAVTAGYAALGNMVGGIALVTVLRLLQVPHRVKQERDHPAPGVPIGDGRRAEDLHTEVA
ncbi:MAG TPA: formate/nitrite transporter family protein [Acidimicrobiales bacterium]|nr:formate/nitrite transporter family protein [Acidimicrobiales bacterium]